MRPSGKKSIPESLFRVLRMLKRVLKWRIFVLIMAAGMAWHTWEFQWVPQVMIPCYGQYVNDPQKETLDWQMAHPFMAGVWSGASLGFWPDGYAVPKGCSYVNEGAGVPPWTYTPFAHLAFPAFRIWATLFTALFVWLYAAFLAWAFRPAPTGRPLGWKSLWPRRTHPQAPSSTSLSPDSERHGNTSSPSQDSPTSSENRCRPS